MLSELPRTPNWCALTQYRPLNFVLLDAIMLLKMWLDPGAPPQLAGLHIQGRIQVLRKGGGSIIFDVAKYIGVLEVEGGECYMHVNPPSFIQRLCHFGD